MVGRINLQVLLTDGLILSRRLSSIKGCDVLNKIWKIGSRAVKRSWPSWCSELATDMVTESSAQDDQALPAVQGSTVNV
jgi:hypothetical protein